MTSTGFENYAEALKIYLAKYREVSCFDFCPFSLTFSSFIFSTQKERLNNTTTYQFQSQNQRGDNQNQQRPGSSYGAAAGQAAATGTSAGGGIDPSTSTTYQGQEEGVNSILSPHGLDPSQQQGVPYGAVYPPAATNNGVGSDPY